MILKACTLIWDAFLNLIDCGELTLQAKPEKKIHPLFITIHSCHKYRLINLPANTDILQHAVLVCYYEGLVQQSKGMHSECSRYAEYQCQASEHINTTPCTILNYPVGSNCWFSSCIHLEYRNALVASVHVIGTAIIATMALLYWLQQSHLFGCHHPNRKSKASHLLAKTQFLLVTFLFHLMPLHN